MISSRFALRKRFLPFAVLFLPLFGLPDMARATEGVPSTYGEVMSWYLEQAEDGKAEAAYRLALQFENGVRPGGDAEVARWLEEAASRGHPQAAFRIASDLWSGAADTDAGDAERARSLFAVASGGGLAPAAFNLGVMAELGAGGPVDLDLADAAYRKAARGGVAGAFLRLAAVAQASGSGTDADILSWLMLAASEGDVTAAALLDQAAELSDPETLAEARKKAADW